MRCYMSLNAGTGALLFLATSFLVTVPQSRGSVTLTTSGCYESAVASTYGGDSTNIYRYDTYPEFGLSSVVQDSNTVTSTLNLAPQGDGDAFSYSIDLLVGAGDGYDGWSYAGGNTRFDVEVPTVYGFEGAFALSGDMRISQLVRLTEYGSGATLFENEQTSLATIDQSFTLGEQDGDHSNTLTGSLTGTLDPGRYSLYHEYKLTDAAPTSPDSGTASGGFAMTLTPVSAGAVPEPSAFLIWSLLAVVGWWRWKR